jgi:hypothetical protein
VTARFSYGILALHEPLYRAGAAGARDLALLIDRLGFAASRILIGHMHSSVTSIVRALPRIR